MPIVVRLKSPSCIGARVAPTPRQLPAGLCFAARYRTTASVAYVGGDFRSAIGTIA